jgi:hypothetical protein
MVTGPGGERQMNDSRSEGAYSLPHDAEFSAEPISDRMTRDRETRDGRRCCFVVRTTASARLAQQVPA